MAADDRRYGQWQLRHLLGLLTAAAVLLAIVAPLFRRLDPATQLAASLKVLVVVGAAGAIIVYLAVRRQKLERQAGPLVERFERRASRIWSWVMVLLLWIGYAGTVVTQEIDPHSVVWFPGSPILLFFAVNYLVVRFWWRMDPLGIEAHENGLILGSIAFHPWDAVSRYSFTGSPPRQVNLFLKQQRMVLNLKIDPSFADRLQEILAPRIAGPRGAAFGAATRLVEAGGAVAGT